MTIPFLATLAPVSPPGGDFQTWAALGVGGVLAWGIFLLYRRDVAKYLEEWKGQSTLLLGVVERTTAAIVENTRTVGLLNERLERQERDRERDRVEREREHAERIIGERRGRARE